MEIIRTLSAFTTAGLIAWTALAMADDQSADPTSKDSSPKSASEVIGDLPPTGAGRPEDNEEDCD